MALGTCLLREIQRGFLAFLRLFFLFSPFCSFHYSLFLLSVFLSFALSFSISFISATLLHLCAGFLLACLSTVSAFAANSLPQSSPSIA